VGEQRRDGGNEDRDGLSESSWFHMTTGQKSG
jgi:hypothetical protein